MKFDHDDPLDGLVLRTAISPPSDFAQRVIARLPAGAPSVVLAATQPSAWARLRNASATLALAASALAGFSQVLMYVFGMWLATSTG
jgi:hypothetical protein